MSEDADDTMYVPEVTWGSTLVWRGGSLMEDDSEARAAAADMGKLIEPAVTAGGAGPALQITSSDGSRHSFPIDIDPLEFDYSSMTPIQRACQVVAQMDYHAAPETGWEAVIVSGESVIWRPPRHYIHEHRHIALERAAVTLIDDMRPATEKFWGDESWGAAILCHTDLGAERFLPVGGGQRWRTKFEAWQHAAQVLAVAMPRALESQERTPIIEWPDPASSSGQAA